jgi:adenine-specific DNA-methyltransferase
MYDAIAVTTTPRDPARPAGKSNFRPVHYLGSKLRYIDDIVSAVGEADRERGPVCDLFSGSGTVSLALAAERQVIAVDIQNYSAVLCGALLSPARDILGQEDLNRVLDGSKLLARLRLACAPLLAVEARATTRASQGDLSLLRHVIEDGSLVAAQSGEWPSNQEVRQAVSQTLANLEAADLLGTQSVVTRHYGGAFYSFAQAVELDALAVDARASSQPEKLAALLSTASAAVNTVGKQFAQPLRLTAKDGSLKRHLAAKILRERATPIGPTYLSMFNRYAALPRPIATDNRVIVGDYAKVLPTLKGTVSVVYADPPYTRDHYSRFYHVLETLSLGDDPEIDTSNLSERLSRGFYRADRVQSDFCIKSKAPAAFERLIGGVADLKVPLVLSYSAFDADRGGRPRLLSITDVRDLASKSFRSVRIERIANSGHNKLASIGLSKGSDTSAEVIFLCQDPIRR